MDIVCIVWNCLQSGSGSSLSLSQGARDGGEVEAVLKNSVTRVCIILYSNHFTSHRKIAV